RVALDLLLTQRHVVGERIRVGRFLAVACRFPRQVSRHAAEPRSDRAARGVVLLGAGHEVDERVLGDVRGLGGRSAIEKRDAIDRIAMPPVQRHERRLVALPHAGEKDELGLWIFGRHVHGRWLHTYCAGLPKRFQRYSASGWREGWARSKAGKAR